MEGAMTVLIISVFWGVCTTYSDSVEQWLAKGDPQRATASALPGDANFGAQFQTSAFADQGVGQVVCILMKRSR